MSDHELVHFNSMSFVPFDIGNLESEGVRRLFRQTTSSLQGLKIEMVTNGKSPWSRQELVAATIGLAAPNPVIRFIDSLSKEERIEAIAHELVHILLVHRFGLRVIGRRTPHPENGDEVTRYFSDMHKNWEYLLGQVGNTTHHLILIDYLKEEYGLESKLHLRLLPHTFRHVMEENSTDKESLYGKGVVAFECARLAVKGAIGLNCQPEGFWKAYSSAQKHFGSYAFRAMPPPSTYEENVLSFLEDLGYPRRDFVFLPGR